MPEWLSLLSGIAVTITAIAAAVRVFGVDRLLKGFREFLADWQGEPARPGREAVPSVPERLGRVEQRGANIEHFVRGDLSSRVEATRMDVAASRQQAADNHDALVRLEDRVTDHRKRNDETARRLEEAISRQESRLARIEERGHRHRATDPPEEPQ